MIQGIVLAAGKADRMGVSKQLLTLEGEPIIRRVVKQVKASNFDLITVVLGAYADRIRPLLSDLGVKIVFNPDYSLGQSTSLKAGLEGYTDSIEGAAFVLGDQPLIKVETYNYLIKVFKAAGSGILLPTYLGQRGNPVFFHYKFFPELLEVEGDYGGRDVIKAHNDQVKIVEVCDPGITIDLDYPEDYRRLSAELNTTMGGKSNSEN